jgi:hypothetical protein
MRVSLLLGRLSAGVFERHPIMGHRKISLGDFFDVGDCNGAILFDDAAVRMLL